MSFSNTTPTAAVLPKRLNPVSPALQRLSLPWSIPSGELRLHHLKTAILNLLMFPVLPLVGYFGLDATGVTQWIIHDNDVLRQILGEGFGHAGLCFALHYLLTSAKHFWKALFPAV